MSAWARRWDCLNTSRAVGVAVGPVIVCVLGDTFGFRESFWITGALLAISGICTVRWVTEDFVPKFNVARVGFFDAYKVLLNLPGMTGLYGLNFLRSLRQTMILPMVALFVVELMSMTEGAASFTGLIIGLASFTALIAALLYAPQPFVTSVWQLVVLQALQGFAAGA